MRAFYRSNAAKMLAAASVVSLALAPGLASAQSKQRAPAVSLSFDPISSFTPANADPRLAASIANSGPSLADIKFTPATSKARPSQVRVAIRARADSPTRVRTAGASSAAASSAVGALTPTSYKLGVAVGWRSFAVSGDVAKASGPNPALDGRESAVVGVSYSLKRFTGRVAVGAERSDERGVPALRDNDTYSLDVGGAYNLTRNIAVTGGVRYRVDNDRVTPLNDDRRDSQAVYVGTAFKF